MRPVPSANSFNKSDCGGDCHVGVLHLEPANIYRTHSLTVLAMRCDSATLCVGDELCHRENREEHRGAFPARSLPLLRGLRVTRRWRGPVTTRPAFGVPLRVRSTSWMAACDAGAGHVGQS